MRGRLLLLAVGALTVALLLSSVCQDVLVAAELTPAQLSAWFDDFIAPYEAAQNFDAFVFTYFSADADGNVTYTSEARGRCYTLAGADAGPATATDRLFRIGSVGKVITAVAVLQLVERGLLELDAPVATYLTLPSGAGEITVADTLRHTTGLDERILQLYYTGAGLDETLGEAVQRLWTTQLVAPGTRVTYSNLGLTIAGALIEAVTNETYSAYVNAHIARTLNMTQGIFMHADLAGDYTRVCYPRAAVGAEPYQITTTPSGDHYMVSTDVALLTAALANGGTGGGLFANGSTLAILQARQYPIGVGMDAMAFVLYRHMYGDRLILYKDGGVFHFASNTAYYPSTRAGYFAASSRGPVPPRDFVEQLIMFRLLTDFNLTAPQPTYPYPVAATCNTAQVAAASQSYFGSRGGQLSPVKAIYLFGTEYFGRVNGDPCSLTRRGTLYTVAANVTGLTTQQLLFQANTTSTPSHENIFLLATYNSDGSVQQVEAFPDLSTNQPSTFATSLATVYAFAALFIIGWLVTLFGFPIDTLLAWRRRQVNHAHLVALLIATLAFILLICVIALAATPSPNVYYALNPAFPAIEVLILLLVITTWGAWTVFVGTFLFYVWLIGWTPALKGAMLPDSASRRRGSGNDMLIQATDPETATSTTSSTGTSSGAASKHNSALETANDAGENIWWGQWLDKWAWWPPRSLAVLWTVVVGLEIIGFAGAVALNMQSFTFW